MNTSIYPPALYQQAEALLAACRDRGLRIATAESCTGGLIAGLLTEIAGASDVFDRGFVTYSNEAKATMLEVAMPLIDAQGAVSDAVAKSMAHGAIVHSMADMAVSVTGIAGPGGGTAEKPVGLVYIGTALHHDIRATRHLFTGDRHSIRMQTVEAALTQLMDIASVGNRL